MGRKIPQSGKAKKSQLLTKRAQRQPVITPHPQDELDQEHAKREAESLPLPAASSRPSGTTRYRTADEKAHDSKKEGKLRLESRFLRLPLDLVNHYRLVSATEELQRPIPPQLGYCLYQDIAPVELNGLTCPKRPKWNYKMSKLELEKGEEAYYKKWISGTDATLATFASSLASTPAPTFFERNLRVWQELWRVTEISDILLVLVDVRFPLIHYPPSLEDYVKTLKPRKKVIIVLTKTDLVPQSLALAWQAWFEEREGPDGASVVMMESYKEIERNALTQGVGARFMPEAPKASRLSLLSALKKAHHELLQPPPAVANFPDRLARWKPKICAEVNWDTVENPSEEAGAPVKEKKERKSRRNKMKDAFLPRLPRPVPGAPVLEEVEEEEVEEEEPEPTHLAAHDHSDNPFLSIGLIGQPNVGKSSLLNALLQRKVVRASRTPGKTKALQTILWNSTLRLVDCPGLVCPSFSGMASQVLSGILPIQNVEPVLYFVAQRIPLESILKLKHLDLDEYILGEEPPWTTDALLSTYAQRNGFLTAKAGRPDIYRAGAFILRQMHNSAIPWAFRPPASGSKPPKEGIFLEGFKSKSTSATSEAARALMEEESEEEEEEEEEESEEESEDEDDDEAEKGVVSALRSAFSMLEVEGGSDEEESEEE